MNFDLEKMLKEKICCSFCGKENGDVMKMFVSNSSNVCNECVEMCHKAVEKESLKAQKNFFQNGLAKPMDIVKFLDEHCIGQSRAKKFLAVALYSHYKRIEQPLLGGIEIEKSNILLVGPTGSGKTLIAKSLARIMNVPFAMADATALTEAGYVGEDVESILSRLIAAANYDIELAQKGIVYIDEIDKIARKGESASNGRDVSGEGVQQGLLKILEGGTVYVPTKGSRKNSTTETILFDTTNVLFICGGAFVGLNDEKSKLSQKLGFIENGVENKSTDVQPKDLVKYGMIPEFVGRIPVIATLEPIGVEELVMILTQPKNSIIKQYEAMFAVDGIELEFAPDAIEEIAVLAHKTDLGGRGLRSILSNIMLDLEYKCPSMSNLQKIVITKEFVGGLEEPRFLEEN